MAKIKYIEDTESGYREVETEIEEVISEVKPETVKGKNVVKSAIDEVAKAI